MNEEQPVNPFLKLWKEHARLLEYRRADFDTKVELHQPWTCWHCGVPVKWNEHDKRASEYGSFYDEGGNFLCPDGKLHQG